VVATLGGRLSKHFLNPSRQRFRAIGFLNERHGRIKNALSSNGIVRVAGRENYSDLWTECRDLAGQFGPTHFRRYDIGEQLARPTP